MALLCSSTGRTCNLSRPFTSKPPDMPVSSPPSQKAATIPVAARVGATPLYMAYLQHTPAVREWYPHAPLGGKLPERTDYPSERREQVAGILGRQNRDWGAGETTFRNIERLR